MEEDAGPAGYIWDRSTIKAALIGVIVLVLAVLVGISCYQNYLNNQNRLALEQAASAIMGTKVSIGGLYSRPWENSLTLTHVQISNPAGFTYPYAITIRAIRMTTAESGSPDLVVFRQIMVMHPVVALIIDQDVTNLMLLRGVINPEAKPAAGPLKAIVHDIQTREFTLEPSQVVADRLYMPKDVKPLHMTDIGVKENGIPVAQAVADIVGEMIRVAFITAAQSNDLQEMSRRSLTEIGSALNLGSGFVKLAKEGTVQWHSNAKGDSASP
jgi:hypothetical protein